MSIVAIASALMVGAAAQAVSHVEVSIDGPEGKIAGTLTDPGGDAPAVILVSGSGPTNRDGDNPLAAKGAVYKQLAEGLAAEGVAMVRYDKRGMFGSGNAIPDANNVTLAGYAEDVHGWADMLAAMGKPCVWVAGHSEGGIVALTAARNPKNLCGIILLASPGRPIGALLREQLGKQMPEAVMKEIEPVIASLEAGERVDVEGKTAPIPLIFNPAVQGYLIDLATNDPAKMAAESKLPMLIVHLEEDIQVVKADADAFSAARPDAKRVDIDGVNHVFKAVPAGNLMANQMSYSNADLKIDPRVAKTIAEFVKQER